MYLLSILAGGGEIARGLYVGARAVSAAADNPEKTASVFDFIMFLLVAALIAGAAGGIGAFVAKSVLEKNKDEVEGTFWAVGILVLIIMIVGYFVV